MIQIVDMDLMNRLLKWHGPYGEVEVTQNAVILKTNFRRSETYAFSLFKEKMLKPADQQKAGAYYTGFMSGKFELNREIWKRGCGRGVSVEGPLITAPSEEFQEKWIEIWEYDINAAYLWVLAYEQMPNVNEPLGGGIVEEGQCGWRINKEGKISYVKVGEYAADRYILIESPWKKWALKRYEKVVEAKKSGDKKKADELKTSYVIAIGVLKNQCPPLAAWIYHRNRERLLSFGDEDTIAFNTDCLYSRKARTDLPISGELGEFKEEASKSFWRGSNYVRDDGSKKVLKGIGALWADEYDIEKNCYIRQSDYVYFGGQIYDKIYAL